MKKFIGSVLIAILILIITIPVLAEKNNKIKELNPNQSISIEDLNLSLTSLLEEYGYTWEPIKGKGSVTRENMIMFLGQNLTEQNIINTDFIEIPFKDVKNIDENIKKELIILFEEEIMNGKTKNTFNLNSKVTYKELQMILERIKNLLEEKENEWNKNTIPFRLKSIIDSSQGEKGIIYKEVDDKIILSITKKFNTPKHDMEINEIKRMGDGYEINMSIIMPEQRVRIPKGVTYLTANVEIDKKNLGNSPYKFYVKESIMDGKLKREIPFKQLKTEETYSGKEGIVVKEKSEKLAIVITQKFSAPGYAIAIEKITYEDGEYKIYLITIRPEEDTILPSVITYKTIYIEIDKDDLGKEPYNFRCQVYP